MDKIIAIQNFTTAERRKSSRRSARSLNNERRNYAVKNGDRVETQHLRLHLHLSRSAAGGRWRKGPRRALRGRRRTLARKRDIRASRRVHDKSLKRRSPEWRAPPLINAPPNTLFLSLSFSPYLWITATMNERGLYSPPVAVFVSHQPATELCTRATGDDLLPVLWNTHLQLFIRMLIIMIQILFITCNKTEWIF